MNLKARLNCFETVNIRELELQIKRRINISSFCSTKYFPRWEKNIALDYLVHSYQVQNFHLNGTTTIVRRQNIEVPIGIEVSVVSGRFLVSVLPILWAPILRYFDTYILVYFEPKNWPIWTIFGSNYTHFYHARLYDVFHTEHIKYDMNMAFWLWPPEYLLVLYEIFMEFYCTKTWVSKYRSIADTFGKSIEVSSTS